MATSATASGTLSASSSPTSTCLSTGASCGLPSPGTLYLFTFLATLLLLTVVAGGIVSRSVYLRRRQRQLIASGAWVPPGQRIKTEPNLKTKPRIFDAYLGGAVAASDLRQWECMMPFSAIATAHVLPSEPEPSYRQQPNTAMAAGAESTVSGSRARIFSRRRRVLQPANMNIPVPVPVEAPVMISPFSGRVSRLRTEIAYIIAMPMPAEHRPQPKIQSDSGAYDDEEVEEELPFFEFGAAEIDVVRSAGDEELFFDPEGQGKLLNNKLNSMSPT